MSTNGRCTSAFLCCDLYRLLSSFSVVTVVTGISYLLHNIAIMQVGHFSVKVVLSIVNISSIVLMYVIMSPINDFYFVMKAYSLGMTNLEVQLVTKICLRSGCTNADF